MMAGLKGARGRRWLAAGLLAAGVSLFGGCRTLTFYAQAIKGQYQIAARREPVDALLAAGETPEGLKRQFRLVERLRAFAEVELKLPVDGHYRKYADLQRPYVVWNVQAAPRFSLEPKRWWYPVVGRLEYRGYFSEDAAQAYADTLTRQGYDVAVSGVEAYSTLGWFKDPLLNTFIHHPESDLAELLFHELAHQQLFVGGDTDFDEAFATVVGQAGARRWLAAAGDASRCEEYEAALRRSDQFVKLVLAARARLETVYGDTRDEEGRVKAARVPPQPPARLAAEKERLWGQLRRDYVQLRQQWGGDSRYEAWFARELNNARLNTIANYYDLVPGFERLLKEHPGDLPAFYAAAERLSKLPKAERHQQLRGLAEERGGGP
jgi:predicted aminopeptidase